MAYWTIDFTTFAGNPIRVMISKPSGPDVALTPSSNPCSIKEEGDEDLFVPVKTQSGYIEVITESMSIAEQIIPTEGAVRQVLIYETLTPTSYTEPLWMGWVQPKLLTFTPWMGKQKLKIPIECKLSGFKYQKANLPSSNIASIKTLLYRMLPRFDFAYFQGEMSIERSGVTADKARAWLRKQIYTSLFDNDATQYDVLEQICTFFGWTCRQFGAHVYFMSNRNVDAVNTTIKKIHTSELNADDLVGYAATWAEVQITDGMLCSTNNKVIFTEGCRKATAICQLQTFDQSADIDFTQIGIKIDNGSISPNRVYHHTEWSESGHDYERKREYYEAFSTVNIGDFTVEGYNVQPTLEKNGSTDASQWDVLLGVFYTTDYTSDTYWKESEDPTSPDYQETLYQIHSQYFGYLTFKSVNTISYATAGTLKLKLELDRYTYEACLFLKMAGKWYNPTTEAWQTAQPADYIKIKKNEKNVYEYDVPIKEAMTGILELHFVTDTKTISTSTYSPTLQKVYYLSSISVEYESEQSKTYNSQIDDVQATATNGAKFRDDVTYNSNICIRGTLEANSKNFLIDPDGEVSPGLYDTPYDNASLFSPLQRLCDETVSEMNTIGRLYEIPVRWRGGILHDITPNTMVYITPLNEWAYCVGWEMNLRDDVVKLKLLRRKYSEGNQ